MKLRQESDPLLAEEGGFRLLLLGNEAIARGAIEAGLDFATTYPGTPAAEIGDTLNRLSKAGRFRFEYSVNEKVALEVAGAAAISGLNALVSMKHVGVNVASDALISFAYMGVRGALVLVSADDPGCHSSQNEQDNRHYALLANIPMLEPATPQQALEMTREAFRLSHDLQVPVLLRTTTRVSHARSPVTLGHQNEAARVAHFEREPQRFLLTPATARRDHDFLLQRMEEAARQSEASPFNSVEDLGLSPWRGVISSGVTSSYLREVLRGMPYSLLQLGFSHPLPKGILLEFLRRFEEVVVVEELDPYLEGGVRAIAQEAGLTSVIWGKRDGLFPAKGEMTPDLVQEGLAILGWLDFESPVLDGGGHQLPRPPVLCPGCGHRAIGYVLKKVTRRQPTVFASDIGCYTLTSGEPLAVGDTLLCMGASISMASGMSAATGERVVALIGDSTFYHSGIPPLINAVHHNHNILVVVLDNATTAMTGHQPHPGVGNQGSTIVPLEKVIQGCGVLSVHVVDPYDLKASEKVLRAALAEEGVSVVVARHQCRLLEEREIRRKGGRLPLYAVDQESCTHCYYCVDALGCPGIRLLSDGQVIIQPEMCSGCGVCASLCPPGSILEVERSGT